MWLARRKKKFIFIFILLFILLSQIVICRVLCCLLLWFIWFCAHCIKKQYQNVHFNVYVQLKNYSHFFFLNSDEAGLENKAISHYFFTFLKTKNCSKWDNWFVFLIISKKNNCLGCLHGHVTLKWLSPPNLSVT